MSGHAYQASNPQYQRTRLHAVPMYAFDNHGTTGCTPGLTSKLDGHVYAAHVLTGRQTFAVAEFSNFQALPPGDGSHLYQVPLP
jgi:hypothetical protein